MKVFKQEQILKHRPEMDRADLITESFRQMEIFISNAKQFKIGAWRRCVGFITAIALSGAGLYLDSGNIITRLVAPLTIAISSYYLVINLTNIIKLNTILSRCLRAMP